MGMTIDDTILDLTELKICGVVPFTKGTISGGNYKVITEECLNTAIDTMRKYQKIESKIKVLQNFTEDTPLVTQRMIRIVNEIVEVLEDGNDNKEKPNE